MKGEGKCEQIQPAASAPGRLCNTGTDVFEATTVEVFRGGIGMLFSDVLVFLPHELVWVFLHGCITARTCVSEAVSGCDRHAVCKHKHLGAGSRRGCFLTILKASG